MRLIYDLGIRLYYLMVLMASPFNTKAKLWLKGRRGLLDRIEKEVDTGEPLTWFHCSSLGEFEQGRPVIEKIRKDYPEKKILLTFYSPSGYEIRKNYAEADHIFYLPLDTAKNARKFMERVRIEQAFFVKYEFWYHFLSELFKQKVPVFLISGIFREKQVFFKWYGSWYRKILDLFKHLFVQQESSVHLLKSIGIQHTSVSGDTRFDRVFEISSKVQPDKNFQMFCGNLPVVVAGSTWHADEEILVKYINETEHPCKWIIAPHEIHESGIERLTVQIKGTVQRYTELEIENLEHTNVIIVDTIGLLSSLYQYADLTYIGGGFGKGIHNTLEAAAFSKPVVFGPNYKKFREAVDLVSLDAAYPISGLEDFFHTADRLLVDKELLKNSGNAAREYVKSMLGASNLIVDFTLKTNVE